MSPRASTGWAFALAGALWAMPARALDGNDELVLELDGGEVVTGWYVGVDRGTIRLSGDNRFTDVPLDLVRAVARDREVLPLQDFLVEAEEAQAALDAFRADPPAHPRAGVPVAASLVYAGAGHFAIGEWKRGAAFAAIDTVVLGAAAWQLFGEESIPGTVPVLVLDLLIKAAAAGDSARITKRRRRKLQGPLGPPPSPP
ncbi:MAG: hypothetical protein H6742_05530 [Alphaproteobacteria bacterium]|nr:hypothetical protein [Alphaproteobacteria bacterium]